MKKIEEIIKAEPLDKLLNGEVVYSDVIPSSSNEMREFLSGTDNPPPSLIMMMYWDGSIDRDTHKNIKLDDFLPYSVYDKLIFQDNLPEGEAEKVLADPGLLGCLIELRLCLPSEAKEEGNALYKRYYEFTRLFFLLYCESLRLNKPEKRLRTWAMEGFELYDENDASLTELCAKDEEFFLICKARKKTEQKDSIFGIVTSEEGNQIVTSVENNQDVSSPENKSNNTQDWLWDFIYNRIRTKEG